MNQFLAELKRRNVIRVAGLYLAGAWLLVQVTGTVLPFFNAPLSIARTLTIVLAVGFIPALVLAWVFEWTAQGLERDSSREDAVSGEPRSGKGFDRLIMVVLALAIGYFAFDKFVLAPQRQAAVAQEARREGRSDAIKDSFGERSIAVLPFVDMSQAHDQQYLSDGIAEELLNLLARVSELRVISRSSAFAFRDRKEDITAIARKLDVGYILDGSIRKAGNRVRITVQLIDGRSDTQLWNDTFDRPLDDIFAIQDEIGAAVVAQLKIKLLGDSAPKAHRTDPRAFTLFLQSLSSYRQHSSAGYAQALDLAKQALAIDPGYVEALNMLAVVYSSQAGLGLVPADEGYVLAREAADKALRIDPNSADAYAELANIALYHEGDQAKAAQHIQRALELEPHNTYVLGEAELVAKSLGRIDLAIRILKSLRARDPMQSNVHAGLCLAFQNQGELDAAIDSCRTALVLEPKRIISHYAIAVSLLRKGDAEAALAEAGKEPFEPFRLFGEAMAWHSLGRKDKSDAVLAELVEKYSKDAAYNIAYVEAWRGNADSAFAWLDKAVEYKDSALPMIAADSAFNPIRDDPRWLQFLHRLGRAPEQLASIRFAVGKLDEGD
ncbi:MAG: tetratricopeptide repeat protein [Thermomonas sp.]|uniref:tetratricopeptide repeat protein n=1 Tax=Thermomonas sp. TaxID=1971895 RepID=UPI00260B5959|nr:tetratricopeptide repeat protein [Thermomonas sp.]MCC7097465.1 tetratricopeptide repeat protein [Thermomonas sp.]